MKTILVPTDFSPVADNALEYAAALASQVKGNIILVHAIELQVFTDAWGHMTMKPDVRLEPFYQNKLTKIAEQLRLKNGFRFTVDTFCVHGALAAQLQKLVKNTNTDLVVMGTKGADTFRQKFFGTQTAACIREAVCPLLAVPAQARFQAIKNIVYASDFEREEEKALGQLCRFTQTFGTAITVLNIKSSEQLDIVADAQVVAEIKVILANQPYKVVQRHHEKVVNGIWEFITENQPEVLAISIRERDFLETLFHDSVSENLIYQHRLPLLALPEEPIAAANNTANPQRVAIGN